MPWTNSSVQDGFYFHIICYIYFSHDWSCTLGTLDI